MYLVDTDFIVDWLNGKKDVIKKLEELYPSGLNISVISLAEVYDGIFGTENVQKHMEGLRKFLAGVEVLGITDEVCRKFGEIRAKLRKNGKLIDNFDILIAATVLVNDLTLVTRNTDHFKRIKNLKLLN